MSAVAPAVRLRDVVPAESVDGVLDALAIGLEELRAQVEQAERDAEEAERQLVDLHRAPDGSWRRIEHLHHAIDDLTRMGATYFDSEVQAAHVRAAARVAEAEAEADWLLVDAYERATTLLSLADADPAPVALAGQVGTVAAGPGPGRGRAAPPPSGPPLVLRTSQRERDARVLPDDADQESARFQAFWEPERQAAVVQGGALEGTPMAMIPVLVAAMAGLVLLVLVAFLAWVG